MRIWLKSILNILNMQTYVIIDPSLQTIYIRFTVVESALTCSNNYMKIGNNRRSYFFFGEINKSLNHYKEMNIKINSKNSLNIFRY